MLIGELLSDIGEINVEIFETDASSVEVKVHDESVWLTQGQMAELFGTTSKNIIMHLKIIYKDKELETSTGKDFLLVRLEYPSLESKAAHLLYFVVKKHPFFGRK